MKNLLTALIIIIIGATSVAQKSVPKNSFGYMVNFTNHQFGFDFDIVADKPYSPSFEFNYSKAMNKKIDLVFPVQIGSANFPIKGKRLGEKEPFGKIGLQIRKNLITKKNKVVPFLIGGVGFGARFAQKKKDFFGITTPLGVGLEARINKSTAFNFRAQYQLSLYNSNDNLQVSFGIVKYYKSKYKGQKKNPDQLPKDSDQDGIYDKFDKCPKQAVHSALSGCPDDDFDGIPNHEDRCPTELGFAKFGGCPTDNESSSTTKNEFFDKGISEPISNVDFDLENINFGYRNDVLKSESVEVLNQIVQFLTLYPEYYVIITGHTDSIGSEEANLNLSKKRATRCHDYLVAYGIDPTRLSIDAKGESKPLANNKYEAGRKQNRRVDFNFQRIR